MSRYSGVGRLAATLPFLAFAAAFAAFASVTHASRAGALGSTLRVIGQGDEANRVRISLGDGEDSASVDARISIPATLVGGARRDELTGGSGADTLVGGGGDDSLRGRAGVDRFGAGGGDDSIDSVEGRPVVDRGTADRPIKCGSGADTVRGDPADRTGGAISRNCETVTSTASSALTVANSGAWSWFGDPRAIYHEDTRRRTYVGWINAHGDIRIASFDHDSRRIANGTLQSGFEVDDHDNPSLYVRPDGRLIAFWSAHDEAEMFYRTSAHREDVRNWEPVRRLGTNTLGPVGFTYPNPIRIKDGLFLFWRGGNQQPSSAIYHAAYRDGAFYRADGTRIGDTSTLPLSPSQADRIYEPAPTGARAWVHDIAVADGRPVIVYTRLRSQSDHRYRYARWTGRRWQDHEIVAAGGSIAGPAEPGYSGGIVLDHRNPSVVYLSRKVRGTFEVERWQTTDGGRRWSSRAITSGSATENVRPFRPRGARSDDFGLFWMSGKYDHYTTINTALLALRRRPG